MEKSVDPDGAGSTPATIQKFAYDLNGNAWADLDASGSLVTRRLYEDAVDSLFARIDSGGVDWYGRDIRGSVTDIFDATGSLLNHIDFSGYGQVTAQTNSSHSDRYLYTSREYEAEIELQYNRARYLDLRTGAWIAEDPIGFDAGDSNLQRYVENSFPNATDSSGLRIITITIAAFIPKNVPLWQFEPMPLSPWQFKSDNRGFGENIESSRIYTVAKFDTNDIATLQTSSLKVSHLAGNSHRKRQDPTALKFREIFEVAKTNPKGSHVVTSLFAITQKGNTVRKIVSISNSGNYPFIDSSPNIDYTLEFAIRKNKDNKLVFSGVLSHDAFPNYEVIIDGKHAVKFATGYTGPGLWNLGGFERHHSKFETLIDP